MRAQANQRVEQLTAAASAPLRGAYTASAQRYQMQVAAPAKGGALASAALAKAEAVATEATRKCVWTGP